MIEKFVTIKNIGRFRDCTPRGDVTFRKSTLVFAENGRGKTTLCAILRSLQTGQSETIAERKRLGTTGTTSVQLRINGANFTFNNNVWSAAYPNMAIFDSVFVHENIYAGDYVEHDHKKNLYRVIVGAQGAQLAKQIDVLDDRLRRISIAIRTKKEAASTTLPTGVTLDDYLAWQPIADIDIQIQQKSTEITNRQRSLEKAAEIQSKGLLTKISLPELPSDFIVILSKDLGDISADAETHVRQQIAFCHMGNHGETWLSQGLGFMIDNKCPFCGLGTSGNDLIAAYRSHFSAAYKALKLKVAQLKERINRSIGESGLQAAQRMLSSNLTLAEFWKQFAPVNLFDLGFEDISSKYAKLCDLAVMFAQKKEQSPTEPVIPDPTFHAALATVQSLQQSVQSYNVAIDKCNQSINEQKSAIQQGVDIIALKNELANLEAKKKRFEANVVQACREYQDELKAKTALEQQKTRAKEQLDLYCQRILQNYENIINMYLDQFNAGFRITNCRHQYTGGTPSSQYQLQINNCAINLGDSRTQQGTHCFKTALSSGDRSALAFAFFLASVKQDPDIANKIIILDDPFTSQDRFRRTCTQQLIRQLADSAKQVIVLSHDPHFLRLIWEGTPSGDIKVLQMCRTGDNTIIGECDIEEETQSTYLKDYSALLDFYRERKGAVLGVARSIRPFLEGLLRAHFPGRFKPNQWLGDFIDMIHKASDTDGLSHAKADLPEIEAINDYS